MEGVYEDLRRNSASPREFCHSGFHGVAVPGKEKQGLRGDRSYMWGVWGGNLTEPVRSHAGIGAATAVFTSAGRRWGGRLQG